jgi:RNA polymerase sigma-70 factor, ECF subfamily
LSNPFMAELVQLIPKLRAYALVLTRASSDADDLVQDALLLAWKYREGFEEGTNLRAWLFRILRNEFLKRVQAVQFISQDVDGKLAAQLVTNPDQELNLRYGELLEGLRRLSDDTREALLLTVGAGFTYTEAAMVCGCPIGTIKSRVNRARELLNDYVDLSATRPGKVAPCH